MLRSRFAVRTVLRRCCRLAARPLWGSRAFSLEKPRKGRTPAEDGLALSDFLSSSEPEVPSSVSGLLDDSPAPFGSDQINSATPKSYFIETYGCQMNVADTEIIHGILDQHGFTVAPTVTDAEVILLNTCAIRDNAERRVWERLRSLRSSAMPPLPVPTEGKDEESSQAQFESVDAAPPRRVVGVLGCMAERLKDKLLEEDQLVDLVVGPDAYRDLPQLLSQVDDGMAVSNTLLSLDETYADIAPIRHHTQNGLSAFLSIMRGCENMCSFCIVPFTRGRERSRPIESIRDELQMLSDQGFKEVTLLGQNVNSYNDTSGVQPDTSRKLRLSVPGSRRLSTSRVGQSGDGFQSMTRRPELHRHFTDLLDVCSQVDPEMRIRFTSPHPKDFPLELLELIADRPNLCSQIHIPAQSGATSMLSRMRRGYSRDAYDELIDTIRSTIPGVALSTDMIVGFCGETEEEHQASMDLMDKVHFDQAFMFQYSERPKTHAYRTMGDDVDDATKGRRLQEMIDLFYSQVCDMHGSIGSGSPAQHGGNSSVHRKYQLALVEGGAKKNPEQELKGRVDSNKRVIFEKTALPALRDLESSQPTEWWEKSLADTALPRSEPKIGDYVLVRLLPTSGVSIRAEPLAMCGLGEYVNWVDKHSL